MPLNLSEDELQQLVIKSLKAKLFKSSIIGVDELKNKLAHDASENFIPSFLVDFKLEQDYSRGALDVIEAIDDYEIINGETISVISLEISKRGATSYLKPDIVLYNEKTRQLVIMELKVAGDTERQAVTELAAFVQEVKNHLPFSSDLDVTLVVIAESYKTLLNHAVSGLAMDNRYKILCLRPELNTQGDLEMHIHLPQAGWTDIGQSFTAKNTFLSKTIFLIPKRLSGNKENGIIELTDTHRETVDMATDMLRHEATKLNTHGFFLECGHEKDGQRYMAININLLNPYVFLQFAIDNGMTLNDNPLSEYLKAKQLGDGKLQETASMRALINAIHGCFDGVFDVEIEDTGTYHDNMQLHSDFRRKYIPISFDSWGAIGDYVRYIIKHPAFLKHYYIEKEGLTPMAYKQPYLGLQIVNLITGDYLFKNGGFDSTDTYKFCQVLDFYQQRHMETLKGESPKSENDCSLLYSIVDMGMALKEFSMRINMINDEEVRACPPLTLTVNKADHDFLYEIKEFAAWHVNQFTNQSAIANKQLIKCCYDAASYFNENSFRNTPETKALFQNEIANVMKDHLMNYILGAYIDQDEPVNEKIDGIISANYFAGINQSNASQAIDAILSFDEEKMLQTWSPPFLAFADEYIGEVFHSLPLSTSLFKDFDWAGLKETIIRRKNRGDDYLALSIDSAGNFGISNLPEKAKTSWPKDIENYNDEVFFVNGMAGMAVIAKVKWEELENGDFFEKFKK
jgi:hypothetical protein